MPPLFRTLSLRWEVRGAGRMQSPRLQGRARSAHPAALTNQRGKRCFRSRRHAARTFVSADEPSERPGGPWCVVSTPAVGLPAPWTSRP